MSDIDKVLKLRASDLKQRYGVYGHFYDLEMGGEFYPCRSTLALIAHNITPLALNDIMILRPGLVCVMMNPGSSAPVDPNYAPIKLDNVRDIPRQRELVPTKPDITQYQIMKVQAAMGIDYTLILNLSDLRDPRSPSFLEKIETLNTIEQGGRHSIFDPTRRKDLESLWGGENTPVLVGWGRDPGLIPLAGPALSALKGRKIIGVPVDSQGVLFAHPSPMLQSAKDAWLKSTLSAFDELGT